MCLTSFDTGCLTCCLQWRATSAPPCINHITPTLYWSPKWTTPVRELRSSRLLRTEYWYIRAEISGPETSVRNYRYCLRNSPKESSSHLLGGGTLKQRILGSLCRQLRLCIILYVGPSPVWRCWMCMHPPSRSKHSQSDVLNFPGDPLSG